MVLCTFVYYAFMSIVGLLFLLILIGSINDVGRQKQTCDLGQTLSPKKNKDNAIFELSID